MRNRLAFACLTLVWAAASLFSTPSRAVAQFENRAPTTLYDPRLSETRRASVQWDRRKGPTRRVVDQVVLVPDVAAFFAAIAAWDDLDYFPILIDDAELAPKFLRAFRPARVVRFPGRPKPIPDDQMWGAAEDAVARSWSKEIHGAPAPESAEPTPIPGQPPKPKRRPDQSPPPDAPPKWLGPTPPGVVLSRPNSPSLAGAVTLAAGRFQPLIRWEPAMREGKTLNDEEARKLSLDLEEAVARAFGRYGVLGDDCDFLTLAAPYPDRYTAAGAGIRAGTASFDDLIGRDRENFRRWAFAGRLTGDPTASVYRAMCSLFLQPQSGLLFDAYDPADADFRPYVMRSAAAKLPEELKLTLVNSPKADLAGWHRALDPINLFDFIYINSSGGPNNFQLSGGQVANDGDIPATVPSVVMMNHSFSATRPDDAKTLAGAWLSGGAYLYFGSLSEPYIQSFRTPGLVASLLNEGLPIAASVRMGPDENPLFGGPWRLHLIGDPLFRINLRDARAPRWPEAATPLAWSPYTPEPQPPAGSPDATRLAWAAKTTLLDAAKGDPGIRPAVEEILLTMKRDALAPNLRGILDSLRIDALTRSKSRADDFLAKLVAVPKAEVTPRLNRAITSAEVARMRNSVAAGEWTKSLRLWEDLIERDTTEPVRRHMTQALGAVAVKGGHKLAWAARLKQALKGRENSPDTKYLREELDRVQKTAGPTAPPSVRRAG